MFKTSLDKSSSAYSTSSAASANDFRSTLHTAERISRRTTASCIYLFTIYLSYIAVNSVDREALDQLESFVTVV